MYEDGHGEGFKIDCDDPRPLYRCTQCGVIKFSKGSGAGKLGCSCVIAKPWEWIWTTGWAKEYHNYLSEQPKEPDG